MKIYKGFFVIKNGRQHLKIKLYFSIQKLAVQYSLGLKGAEVQLIYDPEQNIAKHNKQTLSFFKGNEEFCQTVLTSFLRTQ